jgi:hypothetical protein
MELQRLVTCSMLFFLALLCTRVEAGVRDDRPNLVGGEIMGRGVVLTLNYERFLNNSVGLGFGFMGIGSSDGSAILAPIYAALVSGDVHSMYLSTGLTFLGGGGSVNDWERTLLLTLSAGYQFHSTNGFFVRPLFTLLLPTESGSGEDYLIWPGLTIGGSF